jgi:ParB family chromosome partitioning protein
MTAVSFAMSIVERAVCMSGLLFHQRHDAVARTSGGRVEMSRRMQTLAIEMLFHLIAGRTRFEAIKRLGWDEVPVVELPEVASSPDASIIAQLARVAENLHRREISEVERAELIAEWVQLVKDRAAAAQASDGISSQVATKSRGRPTGGVSQAARELGMPRDAVFRAVKVAKLSPDAKAEAKTLGLDRNQDALLDAAKAKTPAAQVETLRKRAAAPEPAPAPKRQAGAPEPSRLSGVDLGALPFAGARRLPSQIDLHGAVNARELGDKVQLPTERTDVVSQRRHQHVVATFQPRDVVLRNAGARRDFLLCLLRHRAELAQRLRLDQLLRPLLRTRPALRRHRRDNVFQLAHPTSPILQDGP